MHTVQYYTYGVTKCGCWNYLYVSIVMFIGLQHSVYKTAWEMSG